MKQRTNKILNLILPLITIGALVGIWALAALSVDSEYILPSVSETLKEGVSIVNSTEFYFALFSTLLRSAIAFLISFTLAFVLAVISRFSESMTKIITPIIAVLRALPTIAVVLLLLFWTNSRIAPIIVTLLVVLPTTYSHLLSSFTSVDKSTVEAGLVDGASELQVFRKIEIPQSLSSVYDAMGGGVSLTLKLMVAAEVLSATANSLGYLLNTAKVYFEVARLMAIVIVIIAIAIIIETVFKWLSNRANAFKRN